MASTMGSRRSESSKRIVTSSEYRDRLRNFLRTILIKLSECRTLTSIQIADALLSDEFMKIWMKAFTHSSFSPINYETLETIGDASDGLAFYDYIIQSLPNVDSPKTYDELKNFYMSKSFQNKVSRQLGFMNNGILRKDSRVPPLDAIAEDLFESFSGALYIIGNRYGKEHLNMPIGQLLVNNFITMIFNDVELDPDRAFGAFKTQLLEFSNKARIRLFNESSFTRTDQSVIFTYYTTRDNLITVFQSLGNEESVELLKHPDRNEITRNRVLETTFKNSGKNENVFKYVLLGQGIYAGKTEAETEAAKYSVAYLIGLGLTRDLLKDIQVENLPPEIEKLVTELSAYYTNMKINTVEYESQSQKLYILNGKEKIPNAQLRKISVVFTDMRRPFNDVKIELYNEALKGKRGADVGETE